MRHSLKLVALAMALIPVCTTLHAQKPAVDTTTCKEKVIFDKAYGKESETKGKYDYFVQIRNISPKPLHVDLSFTDFKDGVTATPSLPAIQLNSNENLQVKFGTGTSTAVNNVTVKFQYDSKAPVAGKAVVIATNCFIGKLPDVQ